MTRVARQGSARPRAADAASRSSLILDTAEPFKEISERAIKKVPTLRGATIVNLFFEASTRTRISFEFAEKRLSADTVNVAVVGLERVEGRDARRHGAQSRGDADRHGRDPPRRVGRGAVSRRPHRVERHQRRRRHARASDAGAARPAHAARSLRDARGTARSASCGDVLHSRVARSNIWGLTKMGAEVGGVRPALAPAERDRRVRRHGVRPRRGGDRVGRRAQHPAPAARAHDGRLHPVAARVQSRVRRLARAARSRASATCSSSTRAR